MQNSFVEFLWIRQEDVWRKKNKTKKTEHFLIK